MSPPVFHPSPNKFTWRERLTLRAGAWAIATGLRVLCRSARWEFRNLPVLESVEKIHGCALLAFWHESLGLAAWRYRKSGYHTLTSYSFDGELAARLVWHFGLTALRGSSSRGGARALVRMEQALRERHTIGFTLDGPRGPRREAKAGAAVLSARTGIPIVPNAFAVEPAWRMHSWDRLMLARPMARVVCAYADPIPPPVNTSAESIEECRVAVETSLNRLHDELERELGQPRFGVESSSVS